MINRTLIRIRVFQALFAHRSNPFATREELHRSLTASLETTELLYYFLLDLVPVLTQLHAERLELRKKRLLRTEEDLSPNLKLVQNKVADFLSESRIIEAKLTEANLAWRAWDDEILFPLLEALLNSPLYRQYLAEEDESADRDAKFWVQILQKELFRMPALDDFLEDRSLYWDSPAEVEEKVYVEQKPGMDHIEEVVAEAKRHQQYHARRAEILPVEVQKDFVLKTLRHIDFSRPVDEQLVPSYTETTDASMPFSLLEGCLKLAEECEQLLDKVLVNWETERVSDVDRILIYMATTELLTFDDIPTMVTFNEYIELAKTFSTPKSGQFLNGVIDNIARLLREDGRLRKV